MRDLRVNARMRYLPLSTTEEVVELNTKIVKLEKAIGEKNNRIGVLMENIIVDLCTDPTENINIETNENGLDIDAMRNEDIGCAIANEIIDVNAEEPMNDNTVNAGAEEQMHHDFDAEVQTEGAVYKTDELAGELFPFVEVANGRKYAIGVTLQTKTVNIMRALNTGNDRFKSISYDKQFVDTLICDLYSSHQSGLEHAISDFIKGISLFTSLMIITCINQTYISQLNRHTSC